MTPKARTIDTTREKRGVDRYVIRRPDRLHISLPVSIACQNDAPAPIHLRNISSFGFMGECGEELPVGSAVAVDLPGVGIARGMIRWTIGTKVGGSFNNKIDLALLRIAAPDAF